MPPFVGVPEMLRALAATHRIVVVTSNTEAVVANWLAVHRVTAVAEIAGPESGLGKVEKIRALAGRRPGQQSLWFVGDTAGDMREARTAGALPLGVAWGWHEPERLRAAGAEKIALTPAEIVAIVADERDSAAPSSTGLGF